MALSFATDIRPMFTDTDVAHMKGMGLDLSDHSAVKGRAGDIYRVVSEGSMPPGKPWSPDACAKFKQWQDEGCAA